MSVTAIRTALIDAYLSGSFGLETEYPNKSVNPVAGVPYCSLYFISGRPTSLSQGLSGLDRHTGVLQVTLHYPLDTGDVKALEMADKIVNYFTSSREFFGDGVVVRIRPSGVTNQSYVNGLYDVVVDINWYSYIARGLNNG